MSEKVELAAAEIVHLSTDVGRTCPCCKSMLQLGDLEGSVNHMLQKHSYRLFHIGTESGKASDGTVVHHTVAVLGK